MDLSPEVEFKFPLLDEFRSTKLKNRIQSSCRVIGIAALIVFLIVLVTSLIFAGINQENHEKKLASYRLDVQLNSLIVCPTIKESVIWDLKFDIINPYNDTTWYIFGGYEVSIFPHNQTKLLTKMLVSPTVNPTFIEPRNHTRVFGLVEVSSVQDLKDYLDTTSGTIRFDLKMHNDDHHLVCGDVKVALSSNSSSSCGSMVGDPFACSYEPDSGSKTRWSIGNLYPLLFLGIVIVSQVLLLFWVSIARK